MANLYVMVGLPGAGKSYKAAQIQRARELAGFTTQIISTDKIREKIAGTANDQSHNATVFKIAYAEARVALERGIEVVFDATNIALKERARIFTELANVKEFITKIIAVVICPPIEVVYEQNESRERKVSRNVIDKMLASFQFPQKFEGFDEIWLNDYTENSIILWDEDLAEDIEDRMHDFDQKNEHHLYSLGTHCGELYAQILIHISQIPDNDYHYYWLVNMLFAARYHDIGKLFTQTIDENGQAHYHNHDNIGTYYLANHFNIMHSMKDPSDWDDLYETLFFVNYHMRAHRDFCGEKAEKKYRKIFGNERFDMLMLFAECDKLASGTYKGKES